MLEHERVVRGFPRASMRLPKERIADPDRASIT